MVFQRSVGQPLASVVKTLAVNSQNRQTFWANIHQLGPKLTHGHLRLHKNCWDYSVIVGLGPRWTKSEKTALADRNFNFFLNFLDRNAVRIRSSIVSNLSKINQIFNLSPNQERFVSLTFNLGPYSTLFLRSNQYHHLVCDTDEILF